MVITYLCCRDISNKKKIQGQKPAHEKLPSSLNEITFSERTNLDEQKLRLSSPEKNLSLSSQIVPIVHVVVEPVVPVVPPVVKLEPNTLTMAMLDDDSSGDEEVLDGG